MAVPAKDDRLTLIAISALACILQDILHEGLGHGVTAWLSGARSVTMSTVALQSDLDTRWLAANGTLVNLLFGAIFVRDRGRILPIAVDEIERLEADDDYVAVHSRGRRFLVYLGMNGPEAIELLRQKRPGALFNDQFADYLSTVDRDSLEPF